MFTLLPLSVVLSVLSGPKSETVDEFFVLTTTEEEGVAVGVVVVLFVKLITVLFASVKISFAE